MKKRRRTTVGATLLTLAVAGVPSLGALRQEVKLTYKWTKGEAIRYRMVQQTTSTLSGLPGGMPDVTVEQVTDQVFRTTVESVAPDGSTILQQVIESVRMDVNSPMAKIRFDSTKPAPTTNPAEEAIKNVFSAMIGESFTITLTPSGTVQKVEGFTRVMDKVFKSLPSNPAADAMLEGMKAGLTDDAIKSMFSQGFVEFPDRSLKQGDTWETKVSVPNPVLGQLTTTSSSTLASVEAGSGAQMAKIATKLKVEKDTAAPPVAGPMGMTAELKDGSGDAEVLFDVAKGRVQRGTTRLSMPMTLSGPRPDGSAISMQTNAKTVLTIELIEK
jgi:Family of unknown function (DUF6263)